MRIADILEEAVNYLGDKTGFSCHAIEDALVVADAPGWMDQSICEGLANMGLDPGGTEEFSEFPYGPRRQYARALWLTWAAMMAREQGV